jgi:hypothetical protein
MTVSFDSSLLNDFREQCKRLNYPTAAGNGDRVTATLPGEKNS